MTEQQPTQPAPVYDVSVVIPHLNDAERLRACVALLQNQSFTGSFEIVVADNGSSVAPEELAGSLADARGGVPVTVILCPEKGAGPSRNAGASAARGRVLAFIDSDCRPRRDWLTEGVAALRDSDFVGGAMEVEAADPARPNGVEAFEQVFAFRNAFYVTQKGFSVTANLFVPKALFESVGGFRNHVSEDVEWCHRARAGGYRLGYAAKARVGHPARSDWSELRRKWERTTREAYLLSREQPGGRLRWFLRSWAVLASILPHLGWIARSELLPSASTRLAAAGVLARLRMFRFAKAQQLLLSDFGPQGSGAPRR